MEFFLCNKFNLPSSYVKSTMQQSSAVSKALWPQSVNCLVRVSFALKMVRGGGWKQKSSDFFEKKLTYSQSAT